MKNFLNRLYRLGKIAGIPIEVHGTLLAFLAILPIIVFFVTPSGKLGETYLYMLKFIPVIQFSVLVHELGHAFTARYLGYNPSIILSSIGGQAIMEEEWHKNTGDFWLVLNGPLFTLILSGITAGLLEIWPDNEILRMILFVNVGLLIYNMLPIYPLDGGRLLKSWMTAWHNGDWLKATRRTWYLSMAFSVIAVPFVWENFGGFAVALLLFLAFPGAWAEVSFLTEQEAQRRFDEEQERLFEAQTAERDKQLAIVREAAVNKYPDDVTKQLDFLNVWNEYYDLLLQIGQIIINKYRDESREYKVNKMRAIVDYLPSISEDDRYDFNYRYNAAKSGYDPTFTPEEVVSDLIAKIEAQNESAY